MFPEVESDSPQHWYESDKTFDAIYPLSVRQHTRNHWTPLEVAQKAAPFLAAEKNAKIIDIGSGVGKFCLIAAHFQPHATYYGIEQRKNLVEEANKAKKILGHKQVKFSNGNFTKLDLRKYNAVYFFNSFYENIVEVHKIDDTIERSDALFHRYNQHLFWQLDRMAVGTRLATYHSTEKEIPPSFYEVGTHINGLLKFWIKA